MPYFDFNGIVDTPDQEEERRQRFLRTLVGQPGAGVLGAAKPDIPPSLTTNQPGTRNYDLSVAATNQPTIPPVRTTPVTPPAIGASQPPISSLPMPFPTPRPVRPDVMPTREDFANKPELSGWKKVLGLGLSALAGPQRAGPLAQQILHGQEQKSDKQYQAAVTDWEREQQDKERAARTENLLSEARNRTEKPDKADWVVAVNPASGNAEYYDRQNNKFTGVQAYEKEPAEKTPPHITKMVSGVPHIMERDPKTGEYSIDRGVAPKEMGKGEEGRSDKSYQYHSGRIDALRKPVEERAERVSRLEDTLNQGTPQADALVAPELLSVMAGGQASGLRMNEAEISRIVGGRTNWETLKAKVNAWQLDPNKGFALTPSQREQTKALFRSVKDRVSRKMDAINASTEELINTDDPKEHRRIYQRLQKSLGDIDTGRGAQGSEQPTGGKTFTQADIDAAARQYGKTPQEIEQAFLAKGYTKQ